MLTLGEVDKKIRERANLLERITHHAARRRIRIDVLTFRGADDDPIPGPLDKRIERLDPHISRLLDHDGMRHRRRARTPFAESPSAARTGDLTARPSQGSKSTTRTLISRSIGTSRSQLPAGGGRIVC